MSRFKYLGKEDYSWFDERSQKRYSFYHGKEVEVSEPYLVEYYSANNVFECLSCDEKEEAEVDVVVEDKKAEEVSASVERLEVIDDSYEDDLVAIKGIGKRTAKKDLELYPTREALGLAGRDELLSKLRDNVVDKLLSRFSRGKS